jgi:REP element-mobilizing transposase RayT
MPVGLAFEGPFVHIGELAGFSELNPQIARDVRQTALVSRACRRGDCVSDFTGRVNRHIMHGHLWSPSYFAASCGGAQLNITREYIEQQRHPAQATSWITPR